MGLEGPVCESVINRMSHPEISAAAAIPVVAIFLWLMLRRMHRRMFKTGGH